MFHLLWYLIVGFFEGSIAKFFVPGLGHLSLLETSVVGVAGSLLAGGLGHLMSTPAEGSYFHPAGFFMSILGSMLVLFLLIHFGGNFAEQH